MGDSKTTTNAGAAKPNTTPKHDCMDNAEFYDERGSPGAGPLGHGWTCGVCGTLLQVG